MGVNQTFDFSINGQGFMLARDPQGRGRAWVRTGVSDSLSTQRRQVRSLYSPDEEYGGLPDELDHPEVHDDWSGGYGAYYHKGSLANHYHSGYNIDTRFPGMWFHAQSPNLLSATYASVSCNIDYFLDLPVANTMAGSGKVLLVGGGILAKLTPNATPYAASCFDATLNAAAGRAYGHRPAIFGSYVYIPQSLDGTFAPFIQVPYDEGFTGVFGPSPAQWFTVANGRLWRAHSRNLVQSCAIGADPMVTANWSATLSLGNGQMITQDAISLEDRVYVGFPDGLYAGDQTGTFSNVAANIGANVNADNVRDLTVHNGQVVFAEGAHVWAYTPGSGGGRLRDLWPAVDVRPLATLSNPAVAGAGVLMARGTVRCLETFGRWLYAGMFTGSYSMVFCGWEASGPELPYVWHPMQLLADGVTGVIHTTKISRLHMDGITTASNGAPIPRRMWAATDASFGAQTGCTAPVYYWPVPLDDGPPFMDTTFSAHYCPKAILEESQRDWDAPGTWKVWRKLEAYAETTASWAPLQIAALIDNTMSAALTSSGNFFQSVGAPKDYRYFSNANNTAVGQASRLAYLSLGTATPGPTPIYRAFVERGNVRPRTADTITAKVRIADTVQDRNGGQMRAGSAMLQDLRTFALSSNPFPLVDLTGATLPILVIPPIQEEEAYQGGSDYPEIMATVKMAVLDASWPTTQSTPQHPNGG